MRLFDVMLADRVSNTSIIGHGVEFPGGMVAFQLLPGTFVMLYRSVNDVRAVFSAESGFYIDWYV